MQFHKILSRLRGTKFLSKTALAKEINVSRQLMATLESGESAPSAATLIALADFFNVSVDYLLGREDKMNYISLPSELTSDEYDLLKDFAYLLIERRNAK
jgi:transcriptional regulator with XRE-family HTH domain